MDELMKDKRYWANTAVQLKKFTSGYLHLTLKLKYQTLYLETSNNDKNQNNFSAPHSHLAHCRRHEIYRLFYAKIQLSSELFSEFQIIRWWWMNIRVLFVNIFCQIIFILKKYIWKSPVNLYPNIWQDLN